MTRGSLASEATILVDLNEQLPLRRRLFNGRNASWGPGRDVTSVLVCSTGALPACAAAATVGNSSLSLLNILAVDAGLCQFQHSTMHGQATRHALKYQRPSLKSYAVLRLHVDAVGRSGRHTAVPQQNYALNAGPSPCEAPLKLQQLTPVSYRTASRLEGIWTHKQASDSSSSSSTSSSKTPQDLQALQNFLGYQFRSEQLLAQACTHDSNKQV